MKNKRLMSFINTIRLIVFNEIGSVSDDVGTHESMGLSEEAAQFMDDANLDTGASNDDGTTSQDNDGQSETDPEFNAETFMDKLEVDQPNTEGLLDLVNGLGMLRNGETIEFKDAEDIKSALQQGFDYTQKTQALADSGREQKAAYETKLAALETDYKTKSEAFESERAEYETDRTENEVMLTVLKDLEITDPDMFKEIFNAFDTGLRRHNSALNNPEIIKLRNEVNALKGNKGEADKSALNDAVTGLELEWTGGLETLQKDYAVKMHKMGVTPDWKGAQETWQAANAAGKSMTPKQAFFAVHGEKIAKSQSAKDKAAKTKELSNRRLGPGKVHTKNEEVVGRNDHNERFNRLLEIADEVTA